MSLYGCNWCLIVGLCLVLSPTDRFLFAITVVEDRSCVVQVTSNPLHIARAGAGSSTAPLSNAGLYCGTRTQPWLLEAPAGQRINISLLDFTPTAAAASAGLVADSKLTRTPQIKSNSSGSGGGSSSSSSSSNMFSCQYGYVIDKLAAATNKRNVSVCGGNSGGIQQLTNVYLSSSNTVELVLPPNMQLNYLLRMQGYWIYLLLPVRSYFIPQ